ncbi:hypothetical protein ACF0H5_022644 [Mactra antiquata]
MSSLLNSDVINKFNECGLQDCSKWLMEQGNESDSKNLKSYLSFCRRLFNKHKTLLKSKKRNNSYENFMSSVVSFPKALEEPHKRRIEKSENVVDLQQKVENLVKVNSDLAGESSSLRNELKQLETASEVKLSKVGNIKKLRDSMKK